MPIHIVCGQCDSIVRVPQERLNDHPVCPQCRHPLVDGKPIALTSARFERHLTRNDLPLVVDVWAPWCGPCQVMAPHYEAAAERFAGQARFAKVNSDEEGTIAARYGVRGVPTLLVFRNGRETARQSGAMDSGALTRWLASALD